MFDRSKLPDPTDYYTGAAGLVFLERKGKWRTTECRCHGGHDSMRINTATGAFVCMAGWGARGGDVLAYHMAEHGQDFITAARALDCWLEDDGKRRPRRAHQIAVQTLDSLKIPEALLRIRTVVAVTGLSESSIRRKVAAGQFPAPVKDGLRCTRWVAQSVTNWLRKQGAK